MMESLVRQLLPKNATKLERAVVETLLERIDEIALIISSIWNPYDCPVELLPWLAWANSVDVWDDDWAESVKREVIAAAPMVHRKKGSLLAVERAIGAMGLDIDVAEWWQSVPEKRRGTFDISVRYRSNDRPSLADIEKLRATLNASIRASKPKSRSFTLAMSHRVRSAVPAHMGVASRFRLHARNAGGIPLVPNTIIKTKVGLATFGHVQMPTVRCERIAA